MFQVPLDHVAMSVVPSPSKSAGVGVSEDAPHFTAWSVNCHVAVDGCQVTRSLLPSPLKSLRAARGIAVVRAPAPSPSPVRLMTSIVYKWLLDRPRTVA